MGKLTLISQGAQQLAASNSREMCGMSAYFFRCLLNSDKGRVLIFMLRVCEGHFKLRVLTPLGAL